MTAETSYKEEQIIRADLHFQRFSPLSLWWEACWYAGRHGPREVAESSYLDLQEAGREDTESGLGF